MDITNYLVGTDKASKVRCASIDNLDYYIWRESHYIGGKVKQQARLVVQSEAEQLRLIKMIHDIPHLGRQFHYWMSGTTVQQSMLLCKFEWSFNMLYLYKLCTYRSNPVVHVSDRITSSPNLSLFGWKVRPVRDGPCWLPPHNTKGHNYRYRLLHQVGGRSSMKRLIC